MPVVSISSIRVWQKIFHGGFHTMCLVNSHQFSVEKWVFLIIYFHKIFNKKSLKAMMWTVWHLWT